DKSGNTVVTKLDASMLSQIAANADGSFLRASNAGLDLKKLIDEMQSLEKEEFESKVFSDYEDRFQIFLAISFVLFVFEFFFSDRQNNVLKKLFTFKENV